MVMGGDREATWLDNRGGGNDRVWFDQAHVHQLATGVFQKLFTSHIIGFMTDPDRMDMTVGRMHLLSFKRHFEAQSLLGPAPLIQNMNSADTQHD